MKALKLFIAIMVLIVILFGVLAWIGPKYTEVERSIVINAPIESTYEYVIDWNKYHQWSPTTKYDPNMKYTVKGEKGTIGSTYEWEGNDQVGTGNQTLVEVEENAHLEILVNYVKPWEAQATNFFDFEPKRGNTRVTWKYRTKNSVMSRMTLNFMNMDKLLGAEYEKGLESLKTLVESQFRDV